MATITSVKSGNWSDPSTWDSDSVPANGDTVTIATGHTVTFDVDQSSFESGLAGLTVNGTLRFSTATDKFPYLKMARGASLTVYGSLYVGNSANDPIPAYVGSDKNYRAAIQIQTTGGLKPQTNSTVAFYGQLKPRNHTTLAADAISDSDTLILNEDLGLQPYDQIVVGAGTVNGPLTESAKGLYTVSSYNPTTRTVTLSASLGHSRNAGDIVAVYNRPIRLLGPSSFPIIGESPTVFFYMSGTWVNRGLSHVGWAKLQPPSGDDAFKQITVHVGASVPLPSASRPVWLADSTFYNSSAYYGQYILLRNCAFVHQDHNTSWGFLQYIARSLFANCVFQNGPAVYSGGTTLGRGQAQLKGCVCKNLTNAPFFFAGRVLCEGSDFTAFSHAVNRPHYDHKFVNCKFGTVAYPSWGGCPHAAYVESFDHNQVAGAYFAVHRGGTVQSQSSVVPPGRNKAYQYTLSSSTDPVHRTIELGYVEPGKRVVVDAWLRKTTTMVREPTVYLFERNRDPYLFFSDDSKLDAYVMPSQLTNQWKKVRIKWRNDTGRVVPVSLRIEATNRTGFLYELVEIPRRRGGGTITL